MERFSDVPRRESRVPTKDETQTRSPPRVQTPDPDRRTVSGNSHASHASHVQDWRGRAADEDHRSCSGGSHAHAWATQEDLLLAVEEMEGHVVDPGAILPGGIPLSVIVPAPQLTSDVVEQVASPEDSIDSFLAAEPDAVLVRVSLSDELARFLYYRLYATRESTVREVKAWLEAETRIPVAQQRLMTRSRAPELQDAETLGDLLPPDSRVIEAGLVRRRAAHAAWMKRVAARGMSLAVADNAIKKNREIAITAVEHTGRALQFLPEEMRRDKGVVLAAVRQDGYALRFAAHDLRGDLQVVRAAVEQNAMALDFALEELRRDRGLVELATRQNGVALQFASEILRRDGNCRDLAAESPSTWCHSRPPSSRLTLTPSPHDFSRLTTTESRQSDVVESRTSSPTRLFRAGDCYSTQSPKALKGLLRNDGRWPKYKAWNPCSFLRSAIHAETAERKSSDRRNLQRRKTQVKGDIAFHELTEKLQQTCPSKGWQRIS